MPKLRVGMQGRYFLLGNIGNNISLDWAEADYKQNDYFGFRFGKVKTPIGLFNEIQDIDPAYNFALLPQSVYDILSRTTWLTHLGGVAYGSARIGSTKQKLEYRIWGGQQVELPNDPNIMLGLEGTGISLPNGWTGPMLGAALHYKPTPSFMIGASNTFFRTTWSAQAKWQLPSSITLPGGTVLPAGTILQGTNGTPPSQLPYYFAKYEKDKVMVAYEYMRNQYLSFYIWPTEPLLNSSFRADQRSWYAMGTYKVTGKLTAGLYDSQSIDHQQPLSVSGSPNYARYSKDWTVNARYDFNSYIYAKFDEHFISGTELDYDTALNPNGIEPTTKLMILKIGVTF
jgi:hypothetical protein